jgi:hypothetical protein
VGWCCTPILLQVASSGILLDSQIIGATVGALIVVLCAAVAHLYTTTARHGERLIAIETVQTYYLRSTEQNRREVVTPNPLTPIEEAILEVVVNEGGDRVSVDELQVAREAIYRESIDAERTAGDREKYKTLLPVLDARWALKQLEAERRLLPWYRRFVEALR